MRRALAGLDRYIATPRVTKHRLFVWLPAAVLPDNQIIVIARDDDYTFGVLHSRVHELWALAMSTRLADRPRYTPTTTYARSVVPFTVLIDTDTVGRMTIHTCPARLFGGRSLTHGGVA